MICYGDNDDDGNNNSPGHDGHHDQHLLCPLDVTATAATVVAIATTTMTDATIAIAITIAAVVNMAMTVEITMATATIMGHDGNTDYDADDNDKCSNNRPDESRCSFLLKTPLLRGSHPTGRTASDQKSKNS